jgi:hypothetical protein
VKKKGKSIWCCSCGENVRARLTNGEEVYPSRHDLHHLPFWICDQCFCFVGCHHKTANPTNPLGVIATREIKNARKHIHALIDPAWKSGMVSRGKLYKLISGQLGYKYHTAEIKTIEQARRVYIISREIIRSL